jgi:5-methylcytosine-specific restriction enzyme A
VKQPAHDDRIEHLTADGRELTGRPGNKRHRYFLSDGTAWRGEIITLVRTDKGWHADLAVWITGGWTYSHRWPAKPRCTHHHQIRTDALACAERLLPEHRRYAAEITLELSYRREAHRRRARRRSARIGPGWQRARRQVLDEEPHCRLCGNQATQVDHIVPTFRGGSSERDNLQALCASCHLAKTTAEQRPTAN